jgi:hypothetical protein
MWAGWIAAAASVVFAVASWRGAHPSRPSAANARARMMSAAGTLQAAFTASADPAAKGASGDVVWSPGERSGFLRLRGLSANDRSAWQYQLWIFDPERDDRFPVDGGVFDVDATSGDVLIPIHAKLGVERPSQFVVTVEKAGGVVVSRRERVVLAAKI